MPFRDLLTNQQPAHRDRPLPGRLGRRLPDPDNFLASLLTTKAIGAATPADVANGDNRGRYSNPVFDELVAQAAATPDDAARNELYKQAEKIAIGDDLGVIPLLTRQQFRLVEHRPRSATSTWTSRRTRHCPRSASVR